VASCLVDSAAIILFAPLHRSSPFIRGLRCQAIETERTPKAVYIVRCLCCQNSHFDTKHFFGWGRAEHHSLTSVGRSLWREEGPLFLYRGASPMIVSTILYSGTCVPLPPHIWQIRNCIGHNYFCRGAQIQYHYAYTSITGTGNNRCSNHSINCEYLNLQVINFVIYYALFFQRFLAPTIVLATVSVYQLFLEINCTIVSTIFLATDWKPQRLQYTVYINHGM
jgi:hypothetical protein